MYSHYPHLSGKQPVSARCVEVLKDSKAAFHEWKNAGRPKFPDPPYNKKQEGKKRVQCTMCQERAQKRHNFYNDIMTNASDQIFHKLINSQRNSKTNGSLALLVNGEMIYDPEEQTEAWACHFESLAQPTDNPNFEYKKLDDAKYDSELINVYIQVKRTLRHR